MYMCYVRNSAYLIFCAICSLCSVKCEISKKNCDIYQQTYKENSRNSLFNAANENVSTTNFEETDVRLPTASIPDDSISDIQNETHWELHLTEYINIFIRQLNNETLSFQLSRTSTDVETRKKKTSLQDVIPYLIIPGFIMAGVVPWLIPGLKLAVMAVGMVNQMAFTSSLFTLIRGYIFDTTQEEHLVYINNGYNKYKNIKHLHKHR